MYEISDLLENVASFEPVISLIILVIVVLGFIPVLIKFIKKQLPPRLDVSLMAYSKNEGNQEGIFQEEGEIIGEKISVKTRSRPEPAIRIKPKWGYTLKCVEILSHKQFDIYSIERFAKAGKRPWIEGSYTDRHGDLKILTDITIARGRILEPTIIDFRINHQFALGEKKRITVRVETMESKKLFVKDLWLICENPSE